MKKARHLNVCWLGEGTESWGKEGCVGGYGNCDRAVVKKYCKKHLITALYFFSGEVDDVRIMEKKRIRKNRILCIGLVLAMLTTVFLVGMPGVRAQNEKEPLWSYETDNNVRSVSISSDGNYAVAGGSTGSYSGKIYLFQKDSNVPLWSYESEDSQINSVAISSDGNYIIAGESNGEISLFQKDDNIPLWSYNIGEDIESVSISSDGNYIVAGAFFTPARVCLFQTGDGTWSYDTLLWSYDTDYGVNPVSISSDGNYIAAGSGFLADSVKRVYLFQKNSPVPLWSSELPTTEYPGSIAISSNGDYMVAGTRQYEEGGNISVYLFQKSDSAPLWHYSVAGTGMHSGFKVSISSNGDYVVAGAPLEIYLFQKDSSTPLWTYDESFGRNSASISSDGNYIAACAGLKRVYLFQRDSNIPLWASEFTSNAVSYISISSDGSYIFAGDEGGRVYLFDKSVPTGAGAGEEPENGSGGTPGFEAIAVIAALAIALIILRRRK